MTNFDVIKDMTVDELAQYIRSECLTSCIKGVVLNVEEIKQWLLSESEVE